MADSMVVTLELTGEASVTAGLKRVAGLLGSLQGKVGSAGSFVPTVPDLPAGMKGAQAMQSVVQNVAGDLLAGATEAVESFGGEVLTAGAALKVVWSAANEAAQALRDFRQAGYTSGGTPAETAGLQSAGSAIGKSVNDMAALSRSLNRAISSNGVAMGFANKVGMRFSFEPFGEQDQAKNLLANMKAIREADRRIGRTATRQALIAIGDAGEALLPCLDVPEKMMGDLARAQSLSESVNTSRAQQDAAELNARLGLLGQNIQTLKTSVGGVFLPILSAWIQDMNGTVEVITKLVELTNRFNYGLRATAAAYQAWNDLRDGNFRDALDDLKKAVNPDYKPTDPHTAALNANTDATNANTTAMRGMFGGGENARRALPAAYQQNGGQASQWIDNTQTLGGMGV